MRNSTVGANPSRPFPLKWEGQLQTQCYATFPHSHMLPGGGRSCPDRQNLQYKTIGGSDITLHWLSIDSHFWWDNVTASFSRCCFQILKSGRFIPLLVWSVSHYLCTAEKELPHSRRLILMLQNVGYLKCKFDIVIAGVQNPRTPRGVHGPFPLVDWDHNHTAAHKTESTKINALVDGTSVWHTQRI